MISEFESTLVRIAATEQRAVQAVEEACRAQEEARRIHAKVTKAYIGALTVMGPGGSSVVASEIADMGNDKESASHSESGSDSEEGHSEVAGDVGDGDYKDGSPAAF
jgi:TctA family transporter